MRGTCSICAAPQNIRQLVDAELGKVPAARMKLRDFEKICGFSKSALSRHSRKCLPRVTMAMHRDAKRFTPTRLIVQWPAGEPHRFTFNGEPINAENILATDALIDVEFEALPASLPNPGALRQAPKPPVTLTLENPDTAAE